MHFVERVVGPIYPGHVRNMVDTGISPLNVLVNLPPVLLNVQSRIVIQVERYEPFADLLFAPASELLQARQG